MLTSTQIQRLVDGCRSDFSVSGWARYLPEAGFEASGRSVGELVLVDRGALDWQIDGAWYWLGAPGLGVVMPYAAERRRWDPREPSHHGFAQFRVDEAVQPMLRRLPAGGVWPLQPGNIVQPLFEYMLSLTASRPPAWQLCANAALRQILLCALTERLAATPKVATDMPLPIRKAFDWVQSRWRGEGAGPLSLRQLAAAADVSETHCCRLFRKHLGCRPVQAIQKLRVGLGAQLLQNSHLSVKEIAVRLGFRNSNHFARLFRNEFACTPSAYRQLAREDGAVRQIQPDAIREWVTALWKK